MSQKDGGDGRVHLVAAGADEEEVKSALITRGLAPLKIMGEGSYSKVYKCRRVEGEELVAVKVIDKLRASDRFLTRFLPRELAIHSRLHHPNIIKLLDHFTLGHRIFVALELADLGDLEQLISSRRTGLPDNGLFDDQPRLYFRQILSAVRHLHDRVVVHRDLKCENVFLTSPSVVKVGDFGFSREQGNEDGLSNTFCGSRAYVAPEIHRRIPYMGKPGDCWSIGVILFIILEGRMPFDDRNPPKMLRCQLDRRIPFRKSKAEARDLIRKLLHPEPPLRLTAAEACDHRWFTLATTSASAEPLSPAPLIPLSPTPSPLAFPHHPLAHDAALAGPMPAPPPLTNPAPALPLPTPPASAEHLRHVQPESPSSNGNPQSPTSSDAPTNQHANL